MRRTAEIAIKNDYQVCVHAVGPVANRIIETEVDNIGGTITENGVERTFINDTWLKG